jgi:hypothetical protein
MRSSQDTNCERDRFGLKSPPASVRKRSLCLRQRDYFAPVATAPAALSPFARVASNSSSMASRSCSSSSIDRLPASFCAPSIIVCLTSGLNSVIFPRSFHHVDNGPERCSSRGFRCRRVLGARAAVGSHGTQSALSSWRRPRWDQAFQSNTPCSMR